MSELDRQDIVLILTQHGDGPYPFDPIRLMKGCFLVSQLGDPAWQSEFDFQPYDYGPFDARVYAARDGLLSAGLIAADTGGRYPAYSLTDLGRERASTLRARLTPRQDRWLHEVGSYVTTRSFRDLLHEIYARFPAFATRSVVAETVA